MHGVLCPCALSPRERSTVSSCRTHRDKAPEGQSTRGTKHRIEFWIDRFVLHNFGFGTKHPWPKRRKTDNRTLSDGSQVCVASQTQLRFRCLRSPGRCSSHTKSKRTPNRWELAKLRLNQGLGSNFRRALAVARSTPSRVTFCRCGHCSLGFRALACGDGV